MTSYGSLIDTVVLALLVFAAYKAFSLWYKRTEPQRKYKRFEHGRQCALDILNGSSDEHIALDRADAKKERIAYLENKLDESRGFGTFDDFDRGVCSVLMDVYKN